MKAAVLGRAKALAQEDSREMQTAPESRASNYRREAGSIFGTRPR
jgi:hypothetical protein